MKSLTLLVLLFLLVPGSGQLIWDGLPLSTRTEFATLVVVSIAVTNRDVRAQIRRRLNTSKWSGAIKPALVLLALLKLLSFTWYPFSDGFDACYRSIYHPLENTGECEKSYEGPFLIRDDIPFDNTSRIDRTVDFGVHMHDWSLPFMNEYPRMGALWLERFPFTATYGAVIRNHSEGRRFLPVYGNGEIEGTFGQQIFGTSDVPIVNRYEFPRLFFLEVPKGTAELLLNYRFSDDEATETPDVAPPERGPYANLKIGQVLDRDSILDFTKVRVRGWTINTVRGTTPDYVTAVDAAGEELSRSEAQERPDVARYVGKPALTKNGFNLAFPSRALSRGEVSINAVFGERAIRIATLNGFERLIPALPTYQIVTTGDERNGISVWFDADRESFEPLAPDNRFDIPMRLDVLLVLLDLVSGILFLGLLVAVALALRKILVSAFLLAMTTLGVLALNDSIIARYFTARGILPVIAVALISILVLKLRAPQSLIAWLPMAAILAAHKSFDHMERFHASQGERWWGRLLYYWRDSDWYATQGYARTVFLEGSLRGGEALFWFQAGPRYLAFVTRSLLGEQDALIGIVMTSLGFFAVFVLAARFLEKSRDGFSWLVGGCALFAMLYFMSDDLIAGFGFVGSSEYPTWIVLLIAAAFVISTRTESRGWPMVAFALALGYSIQLRPNQIGGVFLMFGVTLLLVNRTDHTRAIATLSKMVVAFSLVVSFSLLHNLYYAEALVPFTANAGINYQFSWLDVLGIRDGDDTWRTVASQLRFMMYWNAPGNLSWASLFWGAQLLWIAAIAYRYKKGLLLKARSLLLLIPFGYALPMLKYQMTSYYPRHLVVINLAFLLTALMAWPHSESTDGEEAQAAEQPATIDPAAVSAQSR
jgi:hypothetical protein